MTRRTLLTLAGAAATPLAMPAADTSGHKSRLRSAICAYSFRDALAKKTFSLRDHEEATQGIECRKDADVIDETPGAYKDIDAVMAAQSDLVEVVHTLKQVVCVKG